MLKFITELNQIKYRSMKSKIHSSGRIVIALLLFGLIGSTAGCNRKNIRAGAAEPDLVGAREEALLAIRDDVHDLVGEPALQEFQ